MLDWNSRINPEIYNCAYEANNRFEAFYNRTVAIHKELLENTIDELQTANLKLSKQIDQYRLSSSKLKSSNEALFNENYELLKFNAYAGKKLQLDLY